MDRRPFLHRAAAMLFAGALCFPALAQPGTPDARPDNKRPQPAERTAPGIKAVRDVEYAKPDSHPLLLDVFLPETPDAQPRPLVVWIHGGGWKQGSKDTCPARPLVPRGYIVASINYRLTDVAPFPAQIYDCKGAIRFLRAHAKEYGIDPDRIGVWGASAGGHLVALLGTSGDVKELEGDVGGNLDQSSRVQAVCDWFGPADFAAMSGAAAGATDISDLLTSLFGGPMSEKEDLVRLASPVNFATKDDPPFLIMHGDQDHLVNVRQSRLLDEALKAADAKCELIVLEGEGHGFRGVKQLVPVRDFFDKQLQPGTTGPSGAPKDEAEPKQHGP